MSITVSKTQLKQVLNKLDQVKLELLRLRAALLPEEEISPQEARKIQQTRKQIAKGANMKLEDLIDELS